MNSDTGFTLQVSQSCTRQSLGRRCGGPLAVRHQAYLKLDPDKVIKMAGRPVAVIDCFGILADAQIRRYFELGCEVKGLGRGHVKRIKDAVGAKTKI